MDQNGCYFWTRGFPGPGSIKMQSPLNNYFFALTMKKLKFCGQGWGEETFQQILKTGQSCSICMKTNLNPRLRLSVLVTKDPITHGYTLSTGYHTIPQLLNVRNCMGGGSDVWGKFLNDLVFFLRASKTRYYMKIISLNILGGGVCRRNIQEGLSLMWLPFNPSWAEEDTQGEELKQKKVTMFSKACLSLAWTEVKLL